MKCPEDVNASPRVRRPRWPARAWWSRRKDTYPRDGDTLSFVASFAEVEVDVETGKYHIIDFLAVPTSAP